MGSSAVWVFLSLVAFMSLTKKATFFCTADPTNGFTLIALTDSNFVVQHPYNVPLRDRYSYVDGVHRMWVYSTDKPFKGYDYSSGLWQFEGYVYVPSGTTGVCIMQIHSADGQKPATDLMLTVDNGVLRVYSGKIVEYNIYNRWMRVNVVHDVRATQLMVYIDGVLKLEAKGRGVSNFYIKIGVYELSSTNHYMESWWRSINVYRRAGPIE